MIVKDVIDILSPWQDVTVKKENDTQLDEPLFERNATNIGTMPDEHCMNLTVCGMDACWGTTVLYVKERSNEKDD